MPLRQVLMWVVPCSVVASVVTVGVFKMAGIESGGWSGGIGAGVGIAAGYTIAAMKSKKSKEESAADDA